MADSLAPSDPYTTSFASTVVDVDGDAVQLDETYFYPAGGGQPADRGTLGGTRIEHVHETDDGVVHVLADDPEFGVGDEIQGEVDPAFRRYCRRAHTASHVLYGAGRRVLEDLGYGGFDISAEKVRVDFETTTDVDDDVLANLERLTNRAVWDSHDVSWAEIPADDARSRDDVAFNTKTEEGVMADADAVRVVTVEDWDVAACGGTHVRTTSEIGPVSVLSRSNPGEGLTRVEFAVGPSAIQHRADVRRSTLDAATTLGVPEDELGDAARRLQSENEALEADLATLKTDVLGARITDLDAVTRDGETWRVGALDGFDANDVGNAAKDTVADNSDTDVVAVAGGDGATFVVVAADGADADAGSVVDDVTSEFGGGGGGRPSFAQGGGLDVDPETAADYLRDA